MSFQGQIRRNVIHLPSSLGRPFSGEDQISAHLPRSSGKITSQRKETAKLAVKRYGISIRFAFREFSVSETCYRYKPKLPLLIKNILIAESLLR